MIAFAERVGIFARRVNNWQAVVWTRRTINLIRPEAIPEASRKCSLVCSTREQLAEQLDCSERTIIRYERAGMPFIAFGMIRRYNPPSVREWMLSKERGHTVPKRGRPAGRKAA